jgi:hypothetical protein
MGGPPDVTTTKETFLHLNPLATVVVWLPIILRFCSSLLLCDLRFKPQYALTLRPIPLR